MPKRTTGCWTCRARKKKCDDAHPVCSSCTLRSITCYGYTTKPEWMDGGDLENEMLRTIKFQCRESYRKRRSESSSGRPRGVFRGIEAGRTRPQTELPALKPWSPARSPFLSGKSAEWIMTAFADGPDVSMGEIDIYDTSTVTNISAALSPGHASETRFSYTERELNMVMYYLDHIFHRLCPFFDYTPSNNGRGWLLNLFLRTKPLCAVAVCLSACDQKQFVLGALCDTPQPNHDLEVQHLQIVTDLRDHLSQLSQKTGASRMSAAVEALACIMHLILFELWVPRKGLMNDWVMHLDAASVLLSSVALPDTNHIRSDSPLSMPSTTSPDSDIASFFPVDLLSEGERSAFEFWLTQYTFYLINSAASLGLSPQSAMSIERTRAIFHKGQSRLANLLGCQDWVMTTMLDIAVLKEWKKHMQSLGTLSFKELARRADLLESQLEDGLKVLEATDPQARCFKERQQDAITKAFIHGCFIFLYTVTSGLYPSLPEIRKSVKNTLDTLEYLRKLSNLNIPSWPYCIAGCLAPTSEYERVRALHPPAKKDTHPLVLTRWTLDIIEECWRVRDTQEDGAETCDWVTAMSHLGTRLLLQ